MAEISTCKKLSEATIRCIPNLLLSRKCWHKKYKKVNRYQQN